MRPFRMFFGIAIAVILFSFLAKVVFIAFIAAAIMSIVYASYRRIKDFITYDRYGEYYLKAYERPRMQQHWRDEVEPLFQETRSRTYRSNYDTHFIDVV